VIAPDVNVLLYALRAESDRHAEFLQWLESALNGPAPVVLFEPVLAAVLRVATHPGIYRTPTPRRHVEKFLDAALSAPASRAVRAGDQHWNMFLELCRRAECRGNLVQDAYFAALALEHGCIWISTDRDFARFPGLSWQHPLDHRTFTRNPL
jgi:uncharacterized protein